MWWNFVRWRTARRARCVFRIAMGGGGRSPSNINGDVRRPIRAMRFNRIGGCIGALEIAEALLEVLGGRDQPATDRNTMHGREREAHRQDSDCAGFPYHPAEKTTDGRGR